VPRLYKYGTHITEYMKTTNDYTAGYLKNYPYHINLHCTGVAAEELIWCQQNCTGKYGWHFEDVDAILTFQNERDAFMYKMARVR